MIAETGWLGAMLLKIFTPTMAQRRRGDATGAQKVTRQEQKRRRDRSRREEGTDAEEERGANGEN